MFYLPAATLTTPVVIQENRYWTVPTVPYLNAAVFYPAYTLPVKLAEKPQPTEKPVQHIIHHYPPARPINCCCDCCDLCCPQRKSRSRTPSPPPPPPPQRKIYDRSLSNTSLELIDAKIECLRRELKLNSVCKRDKSTETIDYYYRRPTTPPVAVEPPVPYKIHYDAPKPRRRSGSSHRSPSLPREPWRSTNQNDYPWRDAHLPAYREATLNRPKTPDSSPCHGKYIYRPKSETEARKYYTETTGKNPDVEVYQSLRPHTSAYDYKTSCYNTQENRQNMHSFYSAVSTCYAPKVVDLTNTSKSGDACIHILPKNGCKIDPPYLKIYNAPVTYLH